MGSNSISALSTDCASRLRQSQIITRVSDIVRELVDNGIDANAKGIQVFLENFGVKKVEVKDSGYGISEEDILKIFRGGYTSKLEDEKHLSCGQHYGFRGEALSSICSFSGVTITTKQQNESAGRKYVLDKKGQIVSQHVVPVGTGTSISVQELFKDFPVRQKYAMDVKNARNELKLIESYLKTVAIANPQLYICLYHNSNVIWTKPAAKNTEQTLVTVMGVNISRLLTKSQVLEFQSENTDAASWKGTIELFVPKPPADMKNVGFTNNKMTMVFVNRRRVFMTEFEQIIKRYALASANCPTQAEQRKFPASVLLINLPPSEVDFNRETDKSKVFLNCKDHLLHLVEKMLQSIYGLILNLENTPDFDLDVVPGPLIENQSSLSTTLDTSQETETSPPVVQEKKTSANRPLISTPVSTPEKRQENVSTFLGGIFPSSVSAKAPQHVSRDNVDKSSQIPFHKPEEQLLNTPASFGANILKDQNRIAADEDVAIDHPKETENIMRCVGILENPKVPPEIGSTVDIFQTPAGFGSRPTPKETPNETSCDVSANSLLPVTRSFELEEIPSNVVIHNIGSDNFTTSNRSSLQTLDPPLKRQKLMQPDRILEARRNSVASDRSNQPKLGELAGWDQWQNYTTSSVGNSTSFVSKNLFSDLGSPRAIEYNAGNKAISKPNYNKPPAVFKYKNAEGLLGISTCVSSTYIKEKYAPFRSKDPSSYDATVIHQLEGTNVFMVKVDGLLGIFHAERFVETCPMLKDPYNSSFSSFEYVMKLLIHFTKVWESMETDVATSIFHVLSDLHELDEKYMFQKYPFAIKHA